MSTDQVWSNREVPWMKFGTSLVDQEIRTAKEAARVGGLDFDAVKLPLFARDTDGSYLPIPERVSLWTDERQWLSIMGHRYPIFQYGEAFDFMDGVSPKFVAAGTMRDRRQGFMVVETDVVLDLAEDPHTLYGVLRTSHDGTRAIEISAMSLRHKCMNQLTLKSFNRDARYAWSIRHKGNIHAKLKDAEDSLTRLNLYARNFERNARKMMDVKVSEGKAVETLRWVFPAKPRTEDTILTILNAWAHRDATIGFQGTGWGLVNAVSEYFEWDRQRRSSTPESKFINALNGETHKVINRTAEYVLNRLVTAN